MSGRLGYATQVPRRKRRRGYTLVLFVMLLFGLMAMAALVIDMGFARLTQRQLQIAAESAALEGLRGEGTIDYPDRRTRAREVIHWHFDDDLYSSGLPTETDDGAFDTGSGQFGAGPQLTFSGGAGDLSLHASQFLEVDPDNPVYRPIVEDGTPSPAGSFRVELRRGATDVSTADLHATGLTGVPYLFARGSLINRQAIPGGIVVRGTGIATARRALSIGLADSSSTPHRFGLLPLALELGYWNGLTPGSPSLQAIVGGEMGTNGRCFALGGADAMPLTVGREIPSASAVTDGTYSGYIPIYATFTPPGELRVVGFGEATVLVSDSGTVASITAHVDRIAAENVSATRCFPVTLTTVQADELSGWIKEVEHPLLAVSSQ